MSQVTECRIIFFSEFAIILKVYMLRIIITTFEILNPVRQHSNISFEKNTMETEGFELAFNYQKDRSLMTSIIRLGMVYLPNPPCYPLFKD